MKKDVQIKKKRLTKAAINKMIRGALISLTGTLALCAVGYLQGVHLDNQFISMLVTAWVVPTLTNVSKILLQSE